MIAKRRRTVVLLGMVLITALSWLLAMLPTLSWVVAVPSLVLLTLDLVALRLTARRRARRLAVRTAGRRPVPVTERRTTPPGKVRRIGSTPVVARAVIPPDAGSEELVAEPPVEELQTVQEDDGTWTPVPVPPPTYTLKPMAPRPEPQPVVVPETQSPGTVSEVEVTAKAPTEPPAVEGVRVEVSRVEGDLAVRELDLDGVLERRRAASA